MYMASISIGIRPFNFILRGHGHDPYLDPRGPLRLIHNLSHLDPDPDPLS
jgi:hypothetical protein